jgi:hypothetical protein
VGIVETSIVCGEVAIDLAEVVEVKLEEIPKGRLIGHARSNEFDSHLTLEGCRPTDRGSAAPAS